MHPLHRCGHCSGLAVSHELRGIPLLCHVWDLMFIYWDKSLDKYWDKYILDKHLMFTYCELMFMVKICTHTHTYTHISVCESTYKNVAFIGIR